MTSRELRVLLLLRLLLPMMRYYVAVVSRVDSARVLSCMRDDEDEITDERDCAIERERRATARLILIRARVYR